MQCYRPLRLVKRLDGEAFASELFVPCGKCYACLQNKQQDWVNRMVEEQKNAVTSYFVTITYSEENVPLCTYFDPDSCVNRQVLTLSKEHLQKFMKRFRKQLPGKCRFFACGEYGSHTIRPHYHLCLFFDSEVNHESIDQILQCTWKYGFTSVSPLNESRMAYCAKYIVKGGKYPEHALKPFCLMSRKPGIGEQYIDKETYNYHLTHPFLVKQNGIKQRLPRYYKTKMSLNNDCVISDALELEYKKIKGSLENEEFGVWRKTRLDHLEERIEKRLKKDVL